MVSILKNAQTKHKKILSISDKGNLIKIQQPDIKDVAILYATILKKINRPGYY